MPPAASRRGRAAAKSLFRARDKTIAGWWGAISWHGVLGQLGFGRRYAKRGHGGRCGLRRDQALYKSEVYGEPCKMNP
jgi:hypothetical protein